MDIVQLWEAWPKWDKDADKAASGKYEQSLTDLWLFSMGVKKTWRTTNWLKYAEKKLDGFCVVKNPEWKSIGKNYLVLRNF